MRWALLSTVMEISARAEPAKTTAAAMTRTRTRRIATLKRTRIHSTRRTKPGSRTRVPEAAGERISGNKDGAKKASPAGGDCMAGRRQAATQRAKKEARFSPGLFPWFSVSSQAIENLIGPEPLEPLQGLVQDLQVAGADAAHLLDGADVLLVKLLDDLLHFRALVGEADAHRAAVHPRTRVMQIAHLHELLEVVGDVGAEIVAARAQLAGGQLRVADIEQQQRLHAVDVRPSPAVEFVLDHIKEPAVQALDESQGFKIRRFQLFVLTAFGHGGFRRAREIFHLTPHKIPCDGGYFSPLFVRLCIEHAHRKL